MWLDRLRDAYDPETPEELDQRLSNYDIPNGVAVFELRDSRESYIKDKFHGLAGNYIIPVPTSSNAYRSAPSTVVNNPGMVFVALVNKTDKNMAPRYTYLHIESASEYLSTVRTGDGDFVHDYNTRGTEEPVELPPPCAWLDICESVKCDTLSVCRSCPVSTTNGTDAGRIDTTMNWTNMPTISFTDETGKILKQIMAASDISRERAIIAIIACLLNSDEPLSIDDIADKTGYALSTLDRKLLSSSSNMNEVLNNAGYELVKNAEGKYSIESLPNT